MQADPEILNVDGDSDDDSEELDAQMVNAQEEDEESKSAKLEGRPLPVKSLFNICANSLLFGPDKLPPQDVKPHLPKTVVRRLEYFFEDVESFIKRRTFITTFDYTELILKHAVIHDQMEFVCIDSDATVLQLKPFLPAEEYFAFCALNGMEEECEATWERHFKDVFNQNNMPAGVPIGTVDIVHEFAMHYSGASTGPLPYGQLAFDASQHGLRILMLKCLERVPEDEIGNVMSRCIFGASQADDDYWDLMDALWCHKYRQKITLRSFCDMLEDMSTEDTVTNLDDWYQDVICKFLEFSDDTPFAQVACRVFLTWIKPDDVEVLDAKVRRQLKNSTDERDLHDLKVYNSFRKTEHLTEEKLAELLENAKFTFLHVHFEETPSEDGQIASDTSAVKIDEQTEAVDIEKVEDSAEDGVSSASFPSILIHKYYGGCQCDIEVDNPKSSPPSPQCSSASEGYCSVESRSPSTSSMVDVEESEQGSSTPPEDSSAQLSRCPSRKRRIEAISSDDPAIDSCDVLEFGEQVKRFCSELDVKDYREFRKAMIGEMAKLQEKKKLDSKS